jgi:hypothetical protein
MKDKFINAAAILIINIAISWGLYFVDKFLIPPQDFGTALILFTWAIITFYCAVLIALIIEQK